MVRLCLEPHDDTIEDEASVRGSFNWAELTKERLDLINEELKRSMAMLEELPGVVARTTVYFTLHEQCTKLQQTLPLNQEDD